MLRARLAGSTVNRSHDVKKNEELQQHELRALSIGKFQMVWIGNCVVNVVGTKINHPQYLCLYHPLWYTWGVVYLCLNLVRYA